MAYPRQKPYVNLLAPSKEFDTIYDFRFLTEEDVDHDHTKDNAYWFRVSDILDFNDHFELNQYLIEKGLNSLEKDKALFANQTLFTLYKAINETPSINYYLEKDLRIPYS